MSGISHAGQEPAAGTSVAGEPAEDRSRRRAPSRDRYLDLLRAIALVRVVTFHTFGGAIFTILFPSMGVMFALAGSLMARSLSRPALGVLASRTRRLLLPLWVYSLTILALLLWHGWRPSQTGNGSLQQLLPWFLPLSQALYPEKVGEGHSPLWVTWPTSANVILWYIVAYFWFMLLSPVLLKAYKARPLTTLFAPLALMLCIAPGIIPLPAGTGATVTNFAMYGSCWMLGFAYQRGDLRQVPVKIVYTAGPALMALGYWWAAIQQGELGWNVNMNITPLGNALWAFAFSAMLLRISPSWKVLPRPIRFLDRFVTLVNNRAMTIYLWHNLLIITVMSLRTPLYSNEAVRENAPWLLYNNWPVYVAVWVLVAVACLSVGWMEDVAAKRSPRLWPDRSRPERPPRRRPWQSHGSTQSRWQLLYPRSLRTGAGVFMEAGVEASPGSGAPRRSGAVGPAISG